MSGPEKTVNADLFTLLAKTDINVVRVGFSRDSASTPPPTANNPLAPYTANLAILDAALPMARARGIKIILCVAEVYGHDVANKWTDPAKLATYSANVSSLWTALAQRYRNESTIVAYDVLNEPPTGSDPGWRGTVLPAAVTAIRAVNPNIWLVVAPGGSWGGASGFSTMTKLADPYVIYTVHTYSPGGFTSQGIKGYTKTTTYPGMNSQWGTDGAYTWDPYTYWDKEAIRKDLKPAIDFARNNNVRMLVGEFGTVRWASGSEKWFADCIALFEEYGWDWCLNSLGGWNGWSVTYPSIRGPEEASQAADGGDRGPRWQAMYAGWKLNRLRPGRANPLPPAPR